MPKAGDALEAASLAISAMQGRFSTLSLLSLRDRHSDSRIGRPSAQYAFATFA
jgi:hypothetical protein